MIYHKNNLSIQNISNYWPPSNGLDPTLQLSGLSFYIKLLKTLYTGKKFDKVTY